ncbi:MAG: FAD-binding oxidoreductase [Rhodospirillales bacterium]|nr:FAD-binding oxidoreductase [Rhodospirillales bacterium]
MTESADIIVIGGGIAGVSAAYELAAEPSSVLLLEAEDQLAYHSTGRSAAMFILNYGPPSVRALTAAGRVFFETPPEGFAEHPLVGPRGILTVARTGQERDIAALVSEGRGIVAMSPEEALAKVPLLRRGHLATAAYEADAREIDVHALHSGYVKGLRARGGRIVTRARVQGLERRGAGWVVETTAGPFTAPVVVDAAGAWADEVAALAGLGPLGLVPMRRTAIIVDGPGEGCDSSAWPVVADVGHMYFKPEAGGKLMVSPGDETAVPPCDVRPDELDIAVTVERFEQAMDLPVRRVEHSWAGLRTFAPDGTLIIGWDPRAEGFFWLAGQGGYGIQTAPAAAKLAAALVARRPVPGSIAETGLDVAVLAPDRLIGSVS